jgi:hypothetical protein
MINNKLNVISGLVKFLNRTAMRSITFLFLMLASLHALATASFYVPSTVNSGTFTISWSGTNTFQQLYENNNVIYGSTGTAGSYQVTGKVPGTYSYSLYDCLAGPGNACNWYYATVIVTQPAPSPTVTASFSPSAILSGQSTTLTWSSSNATSCTGIPGNTLNGSSVYNPTSSTNVTVTCTGNGITVSATAILTVNPAPPTVNVSFSPNPVVYGQNSLLTWSSTGATSCSGSPTSATSGSMLYPITTQADWPYTVTCTGAGGSTSTTAILKVNPAPKAPTVTASFTPKNIQSGQSATFIWSSTDATSCSSGFNSTSGSLSFTPTSTMTQTVTCSGPGGSVSASDTVTVTPVVPPTVTASFSPSSIVSGQSTTLTWSSANATSCTGIPGNTLNGSAVYSPTSNTTVTVTCTGNGITVSATAAVSVSQRPTVTASFSPSSIVSGQSATLTWSSANATSCTGIPGNTLSGSAVYNPTSNTTVTVTCTGNGITVSATAAVNVSPSSSSSSSSSVVSTSTNPAVCEWKVQGTGVNFIADSCFLNYGTAQLEMIATRERRSDSGTCIFTFMASSVSNAGSCGYPNFYRIVSSASAGSSLSISSSSSSSKSSTISSAVASSSLVPASSAQSIFSSSLSGIPFGSSSSKSSTISSAVANSSSVPASSIPSSSSSAISSFVGSSSLSSSSASSTSTNPAVCEWKVQGTGVNFIADSCFLNYGTAQLEIIATRERRSDSGTCIFTFMASSVSNAGSCAFPSFYRIVSFSSVTSSNLSSSKTSSSATSSSSSSAIVSSSGTSSSGFNTSSSSGSVKASSSSSLAGVIYEAENATTIVKGIVAADVTSYSGTGFVRYDVSAGGYIEWTNVNLLAAGEATLTFRYANGGAANRPLAVYVNDLKVGDISFPPTGTWSIWYRNSINKVALKIGNNKIRIVRME